MKRFESILKLLETVGHFCLKSFYFISVHDMAIPSFTVTVCLCTKLPTGKLLVQYKYFVL